MVNKPEIIWEKWVDPFTGYSSELDWVNHHEEYLDDEDIYDDTFTEDRETEVSEEEEIVDDPVEVVKNNNKAHVILSPMGMIPYNEYTASGKIFNFWVGHTNFSISRPIAELIERVDGVEILDIFTRYRFRIAVAKVFEDKAVMVGINREIYEYING